MNWLSLLGLGKSLFKSKWFLIALIVGVIGWFTWSYSGLKESLAEAYANLQGVTKALETTNESIDKLRSEMERIDTYTLERQESRESIRAELNSLREELRKERESNEELSQCWDVDHGDAFRGMQAPSNRN